MAPRRCTNAEPGTFNHECGKPAAFLGRHPSGHVQAFCADCRRRGWEARRVESWFGLDTSEIPEDELDAAICEWSAMRGPDPKRHPLRVGEFIYE